MGALETLGALAALGVLAPLETPDEPELDEPELELPELELPELELPELELPDAESSPEVAPVLAVDALLGAGAADSVCLCPDRLAEPLVWLAVELVRPAVEVVAVVERLAVAG